MKVLAFVKKKTDYRFRNEEIFLEGEERSQCGHGRANARRRFSSLRKNALTASEGATAEGTDAR
jgi:hypothetical protein